MSEDGETFTPVREARPGVPQTEDGPLRHMCEAELGGATGRFVRVWTVIVGVILFGKPAVGTAA